MRVKRIAVVGAGPAGLTAALAASQLGFEVRVYEQATDFRRVGGGIMLHSNGLRVLDALGVLDAFAPHLRTTQRVHLLDTAGRCLTSSNLGEIAVPHNETAVALRYELQEHLLAAAERAGVRPHFGRRFESVALTARGAVLRGAGGWEDEADVVIAADGTHSAVRESLGLRARKVAVGEAYLRGVAEVHTPVADIREVWAPDGRRFGICPLPGGRTYFFCTAPMGTWPQVCSGGLAEWVGSWAEFGPEVATLLASVPDWSRVNYSELFEVRMGRWHRPPAFVIGDAAHAMTPNLGQGANSAMADALVLVRLLAEQPAGVCDLGAVARRHEEVRWRPVCGTQSAARLTGRMAALRSRAARGARNAVFKLVSGVGPLRRSTLRTFMGVNVAEETYLARLPDPGVTR